MVSTRRDHQSQLPEDALDEVVLECLSRRMRGYFHLEIKRAIEFGFVYHGAVQFLFQKVAKIVHANACESNVGQSCNVVPSLSW